MKLSTRKSTPLISTALNSPGLQSGGPGEAGMLPEVQREAVLAVVRNIESGSGELVSQGDQARVYLVEVEGRKLVAKFAHGRGVAAWLRRRMLRKEARAYSRLAGVRGLPVCYGMVDGCCLLLEHFDGLPWREAKILQPDRFFAELREMIDAIHERGVAHGDLKTRNNILVTKDGMPHIIDFGIAILRSRKKGGELHGLNGWLFKQFRQFDRNAWIKLKYKNRMHAIDAADLDWYRLTAVERLARKVRVALRFLRGRK